MCLVEYQNNCDSNFISIDSVNWNKISPNNFPYKIVQAPGPSNPLGAVKIMFPNKYNVYLHDTPNKHLFERKVRTFSHGCIRLEFAQQLAAFISKNNEFLPGSGYETTFVENQRVNIKPNIPVFINYFTAWPDENKVSFYPDVYLKDELLEKELLKKPATF